jgi:hypothetical protein
MERSEIQVGIDAAPSFSDFAALRPGYLLTVTQRRKNMYVEWADGAARCKLALNIDWAVRG